VAYTRRFPAMVALFFGCFYLFVYFHSLSL
jgi:hypothetical protein